MLILDCIKQLKIERKFKIGNYHSSVTKQNCQEKE